MKILSNGMVAGAVAAAAMTLGFAAPAIAQTAAPPAAQQPAPAAVPEESLRSYAMAAIEVQRIGEAWEPRIQSAESAEQVEQLRQEAQSEMISAVEQEGLSVDEYNEIFTLTQTDPAAREQVIEYMMQADTQ